MDNVLEDVLKEFAALAAIPRPSKHEQAVAHHLVERLRAIGLTVEQDRIGNVIANLEPSLNRQDAPLTILQSHMDMVCVADEGVAYNPLTDPIKLIRADGYLHADGTSLGADDGIGIALILHTLKRLVDNPKLEHGAIRVIFTVDEEAGMSGAAVLDVRYLDDATYLLNCDSEDCDELVVGSAGSVHIDFKRRIDWLKPSGSNAFRLTVSGLKGGHSGEEINAGRANAIKILGELLSTIDDNGGAVELVDIKGGKAVNAIAAQAEAIIVTAFDADHLLPIVDQFERRIKKIYVDADPNIKISVEKTVAPDKVIDDSAGVIALLNGLKQGVMAMSTADLVETSANVGIIGLDGDRLTVKYFPRSSVDGKLIEIVGECRELGARLGFEIESSEPSAAWTENKRSRLAGLVTSIFERQNGRAMQIKTIHAGLECSYFYAKNPALDIVSIGTTNEHIHTPRERLKLSTVAVQAKLILETLIELGK